MNSREITQASPSAWYPIVNGVLQSALTELDKCILAYQRNEGLLPKSATKNYVMTGVLNLSASYMLLSMQSTLEQQIGNSAVAGVIAGGARSLALEPIGWLRTFWQRKPEVSTQQVWQLLKDGTINAKVLWHATPAGVLRDGLHAGVYFPIYASLKKQFGDSCYGIAAAGAAAGTCATTLSYWADVVAKNMRLDPTDKSTATAQPALTVIKSIAWREASKGLPLAVSRMAASGVLLATAEMLTSCGTGKDELTYLSYQTTSLFSNKHEARIHAASQPFA
jgi:hypothetical protein